MYNNLLRPYRKLFLLIILLVCGAFFWFFGCHHQKAEESKDVWKEEQSEADGTQYQFENEYLSGTLSLGILSNDSGDHTTPVYLSLKSVEDSFLGTFIFTLPGVDGKGVSYQYAVSAVSKKDTDFVFQIPNMSEASYYQVEILNQYSEKYLSKIVAIKADDLSKRFDEDGAEYNKVYVGVLTDYSDDWSDFNDTEMETEEEDSCMEQNIYYDANTFPVDRTRLQALSAIVIDGFDTSSLSADQLNCLMDWVKLDGGSLFIGTGKHGARVLSGLSKLIGANSGESELTTITFKEDSIAGESLSLDRNDISFTDSSLWKNSGYSDPEIMYTKTLGQGSLILYNISLVDHSLLQWTYRNQLIEQVWQQPLLSFIESEDEFSLWYIKNALYSFVNSQSPNTFFYGLFFVTYIFCLGFFGYQFLRRIQKREYIWFCIPALSLVFLVVAILHSRSGNVEAVDSLAAVKVIDRVEQKRTAYVLYQNKEGEDMSVSLSPLVKKVTPLDYEYVSEDQEHSSIKDINEDVTINDTISGYEIDFSEGVSGQARLLQCDFTENNYLDNDDYFSSSLELDAGVCVGTLTNISKYNYEEVVCIQGNRYQIIHGLDAGAQYSLKSDQYKTWTDHNEDDGAFFESSDLVLSNLMDYVQQKYISGKTDGGSLIVVGLTTDHTYSLLKDQKITDQITLVSEEKTISQTKHMTVVTDLNQYCQNYGQEEDSLKEGILTKDDVEATYQLPENTVVWSLTRDFTNYSGKIYAYNYVRRQNEEILSESGDSLNCGALEPYVTVNNMIQLTFRSDTKEDPVAAPGLTVVLKDLE